MLKSSSPATLRWWLVHLCHFAAIPLTCSCSFPPLQVDAFFALTAILGFGHGIIGELSCYMPLIQLSQPEHT